MTENGAGAKGGHGSPSHLRYGDFGWATSSVPNAIPDAAVPVARPGGGWRWDTDWRLIESTGPGTVAWQLAMERPTYTPSPSIPLVDRIRRVATTEGQRRAEEQPGWPTVWEVCRAESAEEVAEEQWMARQEVARDEASSSHPRPGCSDFVGDEEAEPGWD